uniref:Uncharacterized protein n=1 Tax=Manihot esculenta TaxID=3983 RepID=A0A199UAE1_MANES
MNKRKRGKNKERKEKHNKQETRDLIHIGRFATENKVLDLYLHSIIGDQISQMDFEVEASAAQLVIVFILHYELKRVRTL